MSLADLSRATKIKEVNLELLEAGNLRSLPAQVFVRGFVSAYARVVGADEAEALERYLVHLRATVPPAKQPPVPAKAIMRSSSEDIPGDSPMMVDRRRFGVVVVVLLILVVATLTLSLLLKHGPGPGAGLS